MSIAKKTDVAVIGVGIMGTAIATRLLACGHNVHIYDVNPDKVQVLVDKGARPATSVVDAVQSCDFIILSLNHARVVRAVALGEAGLSSVLSEEQMVIDMSSIDPIETQEIATEIKESCGAAWLDCPLSGGAPKALIGKLTVMAGGTQDDFEKARLVMGDLCANYTLMGPNGAGQTTKLINQLLCAVIFQGVAEAVKLAEAGGVDPAIIPTALAGGRADCAIMQEFMAKFAERDYTPTGRIDNMLKDLDAIQAFAMRSQTALPITGQVVEIHRLLCARGLGDRDNAEMMRLWDAV